MGFYGEGDDEQGGHCVELSRGTPSPLEGIGGPIGSSTIASADTDQEGELLEGEKTETQFCRPKLQRSNPFNHKPREIGLNFLSQGSSKILIFKPVPTFHNNPFSRTFLPSRILLQPQDGRLPIIALVKSEW
ncbi:hypothetical protein PIB30_018110 [Stylosanthes scabra]|uniref:Uncharacterized protein n=1 Tax=Stylosanthes scabra TaxID=79078 RepID=A0ABU6Z4M2_9FABA|nr:hypothetical protein [Stylosanthes scabra]